MYKNEILREEGSLLNHGPSCACKYSAFLYVTHTYLVTNQIKQFNTRSLMNSDNSYFGFRYVQLYLCYYVTEAVLNRFVWII